VSLVDVRFGGGLVALTAAAAKQRHRGEHDESSDESVLHARTIRCVRPSRAQLARWSAAMRSSSGGCDMKSRVRPEPTPPEIPNASTAFGNAAGS